MRRRQAVLALIAATCAAGLFAALSDDGAGPGDTRFFAPTSFWNVPLPAGSRLDPQSPALVGNLVAQVRARGAWINTTRYSVPVYTVPARAPRVPVHIDSPSSMFATAAAARVLESRLGDVPVPPGARPAQGRDHHLVIWQPSSNTMWELWLAHEVPRDPGPWGRSGILGWHAAGGARIDHVSSSPGVVPRPYGATASGLPLAGGLILINELRRGRIDHALAVALPLTSRGSLRPPASRTDGNDPRPQSIPEGTRFRLEPKLDVAALHLPPVTRIIALAAQRYGMVVRDRSDSVVFFGQDPTPTGGNPYPALFGGHTPGALLAGFPWSRLQALVP